MPTILIVEDEAKMRRLLELNLGDDGFSTLSAGDAETGLKLLRENSVEPGCHGSEAAWDEWSGISAGDQAAECRSARRGDDGLRFSRNRGRSHEGRGELTMF